MRFQLLHPATVDASQPPTSSGLPSLSPIYQNPLLNPLGLPIVSREELDNTNYLPMPHFDDSDDNEEESSSSNSVNTSPPVPLVPKVSLY